MSFTLSIFFKGWGGGEGNEQNLLDFSSSYCQVRLKLNIRRNVKKIYIYFKRHMHHCSVLQKNVSVFPMLCLTYLTHFSATSCIITILVSVKIYIIGWTNLLAHCTCSDWRGNKETVIYAELQLPQEKFLMTSYVWHFAHTESIVSFFVFFWHG